MKRQEWMLNDDGKTQQQSAPKKKVRELNPYFVDGGSGLPPPKDHEEEYTGAEGKTVAGGKCHRYTTRPQDQAQPSTKKSCSLCTLLCTPKGSTMVVARGEYCYLRTPAKPVHPLHAQIIPIKHGVTSIDCDALMQEVRNFKKCLLRMWAEYKRSVNENAAAGAMDELGVFCEEPGEHAIIDAFPMPASKSIMDHRVIWKRALQEKGQDTVGVKQFTKEKPLVAIVPARHCRFYSVEFWLDDGFVLVLDRNEEEQLSDDWAAKTAASLLLRHRNNTRAAGLTEELRGAFRPFDWTRS